MTKRRPKSIVDLLCAAREPSRDKCLAMLEYALPSLEHKKGIILDLNGGGPLLPVEPVIVDAVHLACQFVGPLGQIVVLHGRSAVFFRGRMLSELRAPDEASARDALRLGLTWSRGARLGPSQSTKGESRRWHVTHSRQRWAHAGPPLLARELVRRGAIESPQQIDLEPCDRDRLVVDALHPSLVAEILRASPLWPFLAGRVLVGQTLGELGSAGVAVRKERGWIIC